MKRTPLIFNRLIIALALATQLFLLAPPAQAAQNANSSNATHDNANHEGHTMARSTRQRSRWNRRCRERCQRQYRQCLRGVVNPNQARCRQRYRACLRRCGR